MHFQHMNALACLAPERGLAALAQLPARSVAWPKTTSHQRQTEHGLEQGFFIRNNLVSSLGLRRARFALLSTRDPTETMDAHSSAVWLQNCFLE